MTVSLALIASVVWGASDFYCGTLSRRVPASAVAFLSQLVALVVILAVIAGGGGFHPLGRYLWWGAVAEVLAAVTAATFYLALACGTMGVVAPITANGVP